MRHWIWIIIAALMAWDILSLLPVPSDPGPTFQYAMETPSMILQGAWVAALLVALVLWRLYQRIGGKFLDNVNWDEIIRAVLAGVIAATAFFGDLGML